MKEFPDGTDKCVIPGTDSGCHVLKHLHPSNASLCKNTCNLTIEVTSATLAPEKNLYSAYEKCFTLQRLVGRIICGTTAQMCKSQANVPVCFLTRNFSDFQSLSSSSETYRKINQLSPIILTFPFKCS